MLVAVYADGSRKKISARLRQWFPWELIQEQRPESGPIRAPFTFPKEKIAPTEAGSGPPPKTSERKRRARVL